MSAPEDAQQGPVWHVMNSEYLRYLLGQAAAGAGPETLYIEAYANAKRDAA
jgi:hypothetical protein